MIIESIAVRNFGAYAGEQIVRPSIRGAEGGAVTLIGGMNGYGKTSLLEAVLLALYGRRSPFLRQRNQSFAAYLKELSHRGAPEGEETRVQLTLSESSGAVSARTEIRRSWHPANVRHGEMVEVLRDGVLDTHLTEHWDTYVEELVPSGIAGLFFFDGERVSELAESEETTDSLRQAIRTLLGLEAVDRLIADLGLVIRRNRRGIKDRRIREELEQLQRESTEVQAAFDRSRQRIAELQNAIDRASRRCRELEDQRLRAGGDLAIGRERLARRREVVKEELAQLRADVGVHSFGALPLVLVRGQLERMATTVQQDAKILEARAALPVLTEYTERLLQDVRPHITDPGMLQLLEQHGASFCASVAQLAARQATSPLSSTGVGQLTELTRDGFDRLVLEVEALRQRVTEREQELERIERHLQVDLERLDDDTTAEALLEARTQLAELEATQVRLSQDVESHRVRRETIERQIAELGARVSDVEDAERIVRTAARSQETMRQFRERITRTKMEHLGQEIVAAFARLTHKRCLVSEVRVDPDSLRIALIDDSGAEIPKGRLSSGERQMLAVAILWGLARASGRTLPVIIDTPLARLDSSHRRTFVAEYLPNASHQVVVLSTDTEIIGDLRDVLDGHVGKEYQLVFDDVARETRIVDGYFAMAGV